MNALEVEGLCVDLGRKRIVDGVSLCAAPGEIVGLVGPNGAGKSTLLKAIAALLPWRAGCVCVQGRDVQALSLRERARLVSYLPQEGGIHWPIAVRSLVALGRQPHGDPYAEQSAAVGRALAAVDATAIAARDATTLSGGERARVLLARALAVEAPMLLADEPVAALDPAHQLGALGHLRSAAQGGLSVLVVLHDLSLAARFCDRLAVLSAGRLALSGPPGAVIADPALGRIFGAEFVQGEAGGVPLVGARLS